MPRLKRLVVSSRRVPVRFVETRTRKQTRQLMDELVQTMVEQWRTQLLENHGITLTEDMVDARRFRVSAAEPVYNFGDETLLGYRYDITALV
jgi:hypothetical protein